jgi:hypothetical protein
MRCEIDKVPKDGTSVILEDDARGIYELACWSSEQSVWVGENGKPIPITPTHWLPLKRDEYLMRERAECLPQREADSCDPPAPRIRQILPLSSGRAALEWPPTQEDAFAHRQDARAVTYTAIEPRTVTPQPGPPAWRRLVVSSIAAAMIGSSLIGMYFRAPIAASVMQYAADIGKIGRTVKLPSKQTAQMPVQELQRADPLERPPVQGKSDGSEERTVASEAVQTVVSHAKEVLEKDPHDAGAAALQSQEPGREKTPALPGDLAAAREELTANEVHGQGAEVRGRSAAPASELTTGQSNKTANETTELRKAANTAALELQRERERADVLANELAKVRREVEAAAAVTSQKDDEAARLKRKAETATAELQQSLQQQRDKALALESELAKAQQNADTQVATARKMNEEAARTKQTETATFDYVGLLWRPKHDDSASNQAAENAKAELRPPLDQEWGQSKENASKTEPTRQVARTAATEQPVSTEAKASEAAGLLARAKALLGQGNIAAARVVLERAAETGSAQATFVLAETYDPNVLATWRTQGTRGDATKARDLYARAFDGGIKAAKDRSHALIIAAGGRKPAGWFGRE